MRPAACWFGIALLLVACSHYSPVGGAASPLPPATASAARTGVSPTPTTAGIPIPSYLNCRLPYATTSGNGFITFPGGDWTVDPNGAMHKEGSDEVTDTSPKLRGTSVFWSGNSAFDTALNRWLPVRREQVSPDGYAYAYLEEDDTAQGRFFHLHYVSLPAGNDSVIFSGSTDAILGWDSKGIILTSTPGEGLGGPLTLVEPATGASRRLDGTRGFELLAGTVAWADDGYVMPGHIYREDLAAGTVETWLDFSSQGWLNLIGLDHSGHPIVTAQNWTGAAQGPPFGPASLYVFFTPDSSHVIGPEIRGDLGLNDSQGTWLAATDGLYFLDAEDQLFKVSDVGGNVAGPCL
ncbi:MAG TPA: hypothetical protein VNA65_06755 [Candidatus Dormibacteraeota bacterium]|nr:hypothetical protein [Candidatus Dormibacteraeota bacterium]